MRTSKRVNLILIMISTFKYQSFPTFVNGAVSLFSVISVVCSPLGITPLPCATSIGINRIGSVPSRILNFIEACPSSEVRASTTQFSITSLWTGLHLQTQSLTCAVPLAVSPLWSGFILCGVVSMGLQLRRAALRNHVCTQVNVSTTMCDIMKITIVSANMIED